MLWLLLLFFKCPLDKSAVSIVSVYNNLHVYVYCTIMVVSGIAFDIAFILNVLDICRVKEEYGGGKFGYIA